MAKDEAGVLRVVVVGVGPIGLACAKAIRVERDLRLVGLVDLDPQKQGKKIDELGRAPAEPTKVIPPVDPGPSVVGSIALAVAGGADVAVVTTSSQLDAIAPTLRELLDRGLAVVSSCERMAWPWYRYPELGQELDAYAIRAGRAMLGTGVNPGFVMDTAGGGAGMHGAAGDGRALRAARGGGVAPEPVASQDRRDHDGGPVQRIDGGGEDRT